MYVKYYKIKNAIALIEGRKTTLAGRKSKYALENLNISKVKTWSVAEYIRLSQEDEGIRRRQARK